MELQEDSYRIQQVLEKVDPKEIIKFLRTKVALVDTEERCQLAVEYFLNLEDELGKNEETYEDNIRADFLCIRHLLKSVPDEEIQELLHILGPIPNRKYVAVKLLLRQSFRPSSRKKRKNYSVQSDICEASSSKLVKVTEPNAIFQPQSNGIENLRLDEEAKIKKPLKLTIKSVKDRNGNEQFMVTSPIKIRSETKVAEPQEISTTTSEDIEISDQEDKIILPSTNNRLNAEFDVRIEGVFNELPSTSSSFQVEVGPSFPPLGNGLFKNLAFHFPIINERARESDAVPSTSSHKEDEEINLLSAVSNGDHLLNEDTDGNQNEEAELEISQMPVIIDEKLVFKLIEMFPDASPDYIRKVCDGKEWSERNFDEIVTVMLSTEEYPKRPERLPSPPKEVDPEEQLNMLKAVLPDADPSYLHEKIDQFAGDQDALRSFIDDAMENQDYPTLKEYLRKQQLSAQQRQYTTEFNVERFVELFPDPVSTFEDPARKTTILDQSDKCYVKWFMRNKYNKLYAKDINNIVESEGDKNIVHIVKALNACLAKGSLKKTKWPAQSRPDTQNIPLLQELAYFEHIEEIYNHVENRKRQAEEERQDAKTLGLLQTCSCCYDDGVMPNDILTCTGGCRFCRDCIKKGTEVAFSEGKVAFLCLMACGAEFSLQVLQNVLPPKIFSKLAQKKAVAEVKAAGIEDLETCPFCDFATIPAPEDRLFRCLNPDCMKESCRLCKEPSHVPLRCDEVEKDEAVKARTYIEDKMTEALIRQCWKCNAKFIKEEGCNKMTCSCGAIMCYVCRKPVKDYKHFNGQGGDKYNLCPLYTDNFSVNEKNVLKAAEEAKKQIDPSQLKNDPTSDLQKHFGPKIKAAEKREKLQRAQALRRGLTAQQNQDMQRIRDQLRFAYQQAMRNRQGNRDDPEHHLNQVNPAPPVYIPHRQMMPPLAHQPPEQVPVARIFFGNHDLNEIEHPQAARALEPPNNRVIAPFAAQRYLPAVHPNHVHQPPQTTDINNR